jgi:hypothetical protein
MAPAIPNAGACRGVRRDRQMSLQNNREIGDLTHSIACPLARGSRDRSRRDAGHALRGAGDMTADIANRRRG